MEGGGVYSSVESIYFNKNHINFDKKELKKFYQGFHGGSVSRILRTLRCTELFLRKKNYSLYELPKLKRDDAAATWLLGKLGSNNLKYKQMNDKNMNTF